MRSIAIVIVAVCLAAPLTAQQVVNQNQFKDPGTATLVGAVFPGGGQLYAGEAGKGLAILGVALVAPIAGALMVADDVTDCTVAGCTVDEASTAPMWAGVALGLGAWAYGLLDAGPAARRANQRYGVRSGYIVPIFDPEKGMAGVAVTLTLGR